MRIKRTERELKYSKFIETIREGTKSRTYSFNEDSMLDSIYLSPQSVMAAIVNLMGSMEDANKKISDIRAEMTKSLADIDKQVENEINKRF